MPKFAKFGSRRWSHAIGSRMRLPFALCFVLVSCVGQSAERAANAASDEDKRAALDRMVKEYRAEYPDVPELTPDELESRLSQGSILLVDVRPKAERNVSTIPGAVSIDDFKRKIGEQKDKAIVMYCTVGYRSGLQAQQLRKEGFDAYNLRGSIIAWVQAGKPIVDANGAETKRVHVYGQTWNLVPRGYTPVW